MGSHVGNVRREVKGRQSRAHGLQEHRCGSAEGLRRGRQKCVHGRRCVIVSIKAARRAGGVTIDFYVKTKSATTAAAGATTLNTALKADGGKTFAAALVAEAKKDPDAAATLGAATITVAVTKAPKAVVIAAPTPAPKKVSAAPATAVVSMASVAFAALALW